MTMFKTAGKAYEVSCYCRHCHKEFVVNLMELVREGCYCPICKKEKNGTPKSA